MATSAPPTTAPPASGNEKKEEDATDADAEDEDIDPSETAHVELLRGYVGLTESMKGDKVDVEGVKQQLVKLGEVVQQICAVQKEQLVNELSDNAPELDVAKLKKMNMAMLGAIKQSLKKPAEGSGATAPPPAAAPPAAAPPPKMAKNGPTSQTQSAAKRQKAAAPPAQPPAQQSQLDLIAALMNGELRVPGWN